MENNKKRIAVLTSGGDCSGLNAVIWGLIRACEQHGWELIGIKNGTDGFIMGETIALNRETFPHCAINTSGSFLGSVVYKTLRSKGEFSWGGDKNEPAYHKLKDGIKALNLDAIITIGGNGSISWLQNAPELYENHQVVFIPKTIDMDMPLTRGTIGFATAVSQLALYIDSVAQSARSHRRWFVVEAMGRDSGHLALRGGLAGGADAIIIPEVNVKMGDLVKFVDECGRDNGIIVVGEGSNLRKDDIAKALTDSGVPTRTFSVDYFQRGGTTIAQDRLLAARMASGAIDALARGETDIMMRMDDVGEVSTISTAEFMTSGIMAPDPNIPNVHVSYDNVHVNTDRYLKSARSLGIFTGQK